MPSSCGTSAQGQLSFNIIPATFNPVFIPFKKTNALR
jgi:hypothetical protein